MAQVKAIIICAPSGGGKGESVKYMTEHYPDKFTLSVSATTRAPGATEVHGKDYYFLTNDEFNEKIKNGEFLEFKEVYQGRFYGTLKIEVDRAERENKILILEVDIEGAKDIKAKLGDQVKLLFVDAGDNVEIYEHRIIKRARSSDTDEEIKKRIAEVPREVIEGRRIADDIIKNQGSLSDYHSEIKNCIERNNIIPPDEKTSELRSPFKIQ